MKDLEHPLFLVFAFTLLVCLAGIWWLLCQHRERTDHEQRNLTLRESERSVMENLQEVPPDPIPLDQHGPMHEGDIFGEIALLDGHPRTADATTMAADCPRV